MARKRREGKTPNSNNSPLPAEGTNESSMPVLCSTQPTSNNHKFDIVSGGDGVVDIMGSVNNDALVGETEHNLEHASTGNKVNTDNNATTFDKHLPGNLPDVNVGLPSNEKNLLTQDLPTTT